MRKITVNKSDEVAVVVEKIIEADTREVVLSIPRFSHLVESLSNFHLLKREADALGKKVIIESLDDRVIELAELSGLKAVNPFFAKTKRQFSDIMAPRAQKEKEGPWRKEAVSFEEESLVPSVGRETFQPKRNFLPRLLKLFKPPKLSFGIKTPKLHWKPAVILVLAIAAGWLVFRELPRASIDIVSKKASWSYNDSIITSKSAKADAKNLTIPNQVFVQKKNVELKFPATGRKQVEKKAAGKITVYNAYSSDPQPLVINTRFLTPDDKLFRLVKGITVPGAKIVEGKIVPSSIEADIVADQAGPEYNIGPVKLFTIPGLKGTPKYQAFYGESKEAMSGGYIGEMAYPTEQDISAAKAEVAKVLEDGIKAAAYSQAPAGFKILDDAAKFEIANYSVGKEADSEGKFSVFGEARMTIISFKEEDLLNILFARAKEEANAEGGAAADFEVRTHELKYGLARADFSSGKMSFLINFKADLSYAIDAEALRNRIMGRPEKDLRAITSPLWSTGNATVTISLWPFWVKRVPLDPDRIKITID